MPVLRTKAATDEVERMDVLKREHHLAPQENGDPFQGARCRLVPLLPEHYPHLYDIALEPKVASRWDPELVGGAFENWARRLTDGVMCQYAVHVPRSPRPVDGLVRCYGANFRHGTAQIA